MKKKLKSVLLVDDDKACNYLHDRLLKKEDCFEAIYTAQNGKEAIDFLTSFVGGQYPTPCIIFLDINMPVMDGWHFLEEYHKLTDEQKAETIILILSTSVNPDDMEKSRKFTKVKGFYNKILDKETLHEILQKYFPHYI